MDIYVSVSEIAGRGVFAAREFQRGELIETCEVLRVPAGQLPTLDQTVVYEYYFAWDGDGGVAWGYGSLYNHSDQPNAEYLKHYDQERLEIKALRQIATDEEITFNYGAAFNTTEGQ